VMSMVAYDEKWSVEVTAIAATRRGAERIVRRRRRPRVESSVAECFGSGNSAADRASETIEVRLLLALIDQRLEPRQRALPAWLMGSQRTQCGRVRAVAQTGRQTSCSRITAQAHRRIRAPLPRSGDRGLRRLVRDPG